ncbi:hypothetical protein ACFO3U_07765 [Flavobacterium ponti]|uniref:Lipoprotein n=1 Tax=Flavobacterium ponti TaxID=665133 RepID=A0ABV9P2Q4_9FLAO
MKNAVLLLGFLSTVIGCQNKTNSITNTQLKQEKLVQEPYNKRYSWLNGNIMILPDNTYELNIKSSEERDKSVNKPHQSPF